MEDFDVFSNEINFSKPVFMNLLNNSIKDAPATPSAPNYHSSQKLQAEECLAENDELKCAFHMTEAVSASLRSMAVYRNEQLRMSDNSKKITSFIKPVDNILDKYKESKNEDILPDFIRNDMNKVTEALNKYKIDNEVADEEPLHIKYLRFTKDNNVNNFQKILQELPKEWTIVQITAQYNPNENIKPLCEYRTEIQSLFITVLSNDYMDDTIGPVTVQVPANVTKLCEKPLFEELYALLDDNYKTIQNAHALNNKRLVKNYWDRREDIDLTMKSIINEMDKEWLCGWSCLFTGKVIDTQIRERIKNIVDDTILDWGFIKLNAKQKLLLYNLIEVTPLLTSNQIKTCLRRILTEAGNPDDIRQALDTIICKSCTTEFNLITELCCNCLTKCFKAVHNFTLVDGIKAFSKLAALVRDGQEWEMLKNVKRHPVILIVDELVDTFPWESLPLLNNHPVSRMENIHFLYYLFKTHENNIKDGFYIADTKDGRYVINPEKNLDRMEKRMASFVQYWCPDWCGDISRPPEPDKFVQYLREADMFLYCGHGDGCQLGGGGARLEAGGARGAALLAGCGSTRLRTRGGRAPPAAMHHHYHIAASPMVIGMLWEVTDLEVDKVVSALISLCIPSDAPVPWNLVGKAQWSQGILDTSVEVKPEQRSSFRTEPNLLSAMAKARRCTNYVMIASSVVARGLPVKFTTSDVKCA